MLDLLNQKQKEAIIFIRKTKKSGLAGCPGTGKTRVSLLALDTALIICPVSLAPNWAKEIKKWRPSKSSFVFEKEMPKGRAPDYFILSYSKLDKIPPPILFKMYSALVLDEVHAIKNPMAKRTRSALTLMRNMDKVLGLSGTFLPNRVVEIYNFLWGIGAIEMTYYNFAVKYGGGKQTPFGFKALGATNVEELKQRIYPYFFIMKKAELLPDLAAKKFIISEIDMPLNPLEARLHLDKIRVSKRPKGIVGLAEILRTDAERKVPYSAAYIKNFLVEHPGVKCLVFGIHSKGLEDLANALAEFHPALVYGKTKKNRLEVVDAFKGSPHSRVLIGHITVLGLGFTINEASHVFFHESNWVFGDAMQAADRVHRIGQEKEITVTFLTVKNSFDSYIIKRMLSKQKLISGIL